MHKVFVCYHHKNDQWYKNELISWAEKNQVFIDGSVGLGEIPEDWDDQTVREHIRDEYLRDTTVTIVLVGSTENMLIGRYTPVCMMVRRTRSQESLLYFSLQLRVLTIHAVLIMRKLFIRRKNG